MALLVLIFGWDCMLTRNDQPLGFHLNFATENNFNFAVDSVFTSVIDNGSGIMSNEFLLLEGDPLLLLDGTNFVLL